MKTTALAAILLTLAGGFALGAPLLETAHLFEEEKDGFASYRIPGSRRVVWSFKLLPPTPQPAPFTYLISRMFSVPTVAS
jgi:hypothetical protein